MIAMAMMSSTIATASRNTRRAVAHAVAEQREQPDRERDVGGARRSPSPARRRPPATIATKISDRRAPRRRPPRAPAAPPCARFCRRPSTSSRLISSPTTRKNSAISPSLTQWCRSSGPSSVCQNAVVVEAGRWPRRARRRGRRGSRGRRAASSWQELTGGGRVTDRLRKRSATRGRSRARDHADDLAVVDDRDDQHAVVEEDLGDLGVGEVGADVDVLGVHVLADGLDRGSASRFSSASSSERRRNAAPLELVEVAGEQRADELALAEDARVALALVDDRQRRQVAARAARRTASRPCRRRAAIGGSRRTRSVMVRGLMRTSAAT